MSSNNPLEFTSLKEWLAWLEQAHSIHKIELGLDRAASVASSMALLEPEATVISVAGTNGKGTTVAAIEALAVCHKVSVGSYTSPHLIAFNERIKIDGENCSDELIMAGFRAVYQAKSAIELTYFEFTTLVALWIYAQQGVDLIVLEVGLGGRLDAVNIIDADIALVTSIGLDHVDWLGNDIKVIAGEKAGIARADKPLIIADATTESLLLPHCQTIGCVPCIAGYDYVAALDKKYWSYTSDILELDFHELPLSDLYHQNLAAGLTAFSYFYQKICSKSVGYAQAYKAMESLSVIGRYQVLSQNPLVIVDVAHNPDSAQLLNSKILQLKDTGVERIVALCGMLSDKDSDACLHAMTAVDEWHLLDLPAPRGKKASDLLNSLPQLPQNNAKCYASLEEFDEQRLETACLDKDHALIVFGSFVTVGLFVDKWNKEGFAWI